jgi:hypothetical protein
VHNASGKSIVIEYVGGGITNPPAPNHIEGIDSEKLDSSCREQSQKGPFNVMPLAVGKKARLTDPTINGPGSRTAKPLLLISPPPRQNYIRKPSATTASWKNSSRR